MSSFPTATAVPSSSETRSGDAQPKATVNAPFSEQLMRELLKTTPKPPKPPKTPTSRVTDVVTYPLIATWCCQFKIGEKYVPSIVLMAMGYENLAFFGVMSAWFTRGSPVPQAHL